MASVTERQSFAVNMVRWAARAIGIPPTAMALYFLAHLLAEDRMRLWSAADFVAIGSMALMALAFMFAWVWEGPAGGVLIAGYIILAFAQGLLVPSFF